MNSSGAGGGGLPYACGYRHWPLATGKHEEMR